MSRLSQGLRLACLTVLVAASMEACGPSRLAADGTGGDTQAPTAIPTLSSSATPSVIPAAAALTSPTSTSVPAVDSTKIPEASRVVVTAAKGNVFIRRGPDFGFNSIGALMQGQSAAALKRDVLAEWLEIPLPGQPNVTGWISIQSQFTVVDGDVMSLPEFQPDYWPVGASVRNCTLHQMQLTPGNITLPSVLNFPYNDVQVNPGVYTVIDTDLDTYPSVAKIEVREGSAIDIHIDGLGNKKKCPLP